ncbi:MAG: DUF4389 domain-containing protein [Magnetococcales bacterium]|nr:DUF4389 domain-containing protein [Magnetococcales bacterium]
MNNKINTEWKNKADFQRIIFMMIIGFCYAIAKFVLFGIIFFLAISYLATGNPNDRLIKVGAQFSTYAYQVFCYLTFNSEQRPFPFDEWPKN